MTNHNTHLPLTPLANSEIWSRCTIHGALSSSSNARPCDCVVTGMGYAIHIGDSTAVRRHGFLANHPCHMGTSFKGDFPLGLVTSRMYYDRSDECFLALFYAGADPILQAETEEDLRYLKDNLMVFAFRPNASLTVLDAVLEMGIADTEWGRERLVGAATKRAWYHGVGPDGREIWTLQDDFKYFARKKIILAKVPLSEEQMVRFH